MRTAPATTTSGGGDTTRDLVGSFSFYSLSTEVKDMIFALIVPKELKVQLQHVETPLSHKKPFVWEEQLISADASVSDIYTMRAIHNTNHGLRAELRQYLASRSVDVALELGVMPLRLYPDERASHRAALEITSVLMRFGCVKRAQFTGLHIIYVADFVSDLASIRAAVVLTETTISVDLTSETKAIMAESTFIEDLQGISPAEWRKDCGQILKDHALGAVATNLEWAALRAKPTLPARLYEFWQTFDGRMEFLKGWTSRPGMLYEAIQSPAIRATLLRSRGTA